MLYSSDIAYKYYFTLKMKINGQDQCDVLNL